MLCPHCHSATLVEIRVTYGASRFTMHSCPCCEHRWWDRNGELVDLHSVLGAVAAV